MLKLISGFYLLELIAVIVIVVLGYLIWDKRYKQRSSSDIPSGYERTNEVNIDPITNRKQRVYYNPSTGDRIYIDET